VNYSLGAGPRLCIFTGMVGIFYTYGNHNFLRKILNLFGLILCFAPLYFTKNSKEMVFWTQEYPQAIEEAIGDP